MTAETHIAAVVREGDRDRYLADLYAPEAERRHLLALHAFAVETARVRDRVSEPLPGEIRLQWWRDALAGDPGGEPVATALKAAIDACRLPAEPFRRLLEARVFDLYDDPMPSLNDLEGYAGDTESAVFQLGALILAGGSDPGTAELSGHAGVALLLVRTLALLPLHASRRQCFLPADLLSAHRVDRETLFAGVQTPEIAAAIADLSAVAERHLARARQAATGLDPALLPAFLPLTTVGLTLKRIADPRRDPLREIAAVAPWRRQWAIWRAAGRGRI